MKDSMSYDHHGWFMDMLTPRVPRVACPQRAELRHRVTGPRRKSAANWSTPSRAWPPADAHKMNASDLQWMIVMIQPV